MVYYPALISSAIFFAGIVVSLHDKNNMMALILSLVAIPCVLFLGHLSYKNLDIIAYLVILIPVIVLYIGYSIGVHAPKPIILIKDASGNIVKRSVESFIPSLIIPIEKTQIESFIPSLIIPIEKTQIAGDRIEAEMT